MNNQKTLLEEKCNVLADVVIAIRPIYEVASEKQKAFLETIIGAAIWYIPKSPSSWTGYISKSAIKAFFPDGINQKPKLSEEHVYPRKIVAQELLEDEKLDREKLLTSFSLKYGQIHLITPEENNAVRRFQRVSKFSTPDIAYKNADIELIKITKEELNRIKKKDRETIKKCLGRNK